MITNDTKKLVLAKNVEVADNPVTRIVGLLGHAPLEAEEALIIRPCMSVHTFFMSFAIDVIFVNHNNVVIALHKAVKPFRILPFHMSQYVIEMKSGCANVDVGDIISINE